MVRAPVVDHVIAVPVFRRKPVAPMKIMVRAGAALIVLHQAALTNVLPAMLRLSLGSLSLGRSLSMARSLSLRSRSLRMLHALSLLLSRSCPPAGCFLLREKGAAAGEGCRDDKGEGDLAGHEVLLGCALEAPPLRARSRVGIRHPLRNDSRRTSGTLVRELEHIAPVRPCDGLGATCKSRNMGRARRTVG